MRSCSKFPPERSSGFTVNLTVLLTASGRKRVFFLVIGGLDLIGACYSVLCVNFTVFWLHGSLAKMPENDMSFIASLPEVVHRDQLLPKRPL